MRHLGSLMLSLLLTPLVYGLLVRGVYMGNQGMYDQARSESSTTDLLVAGGLVLAASLCYCLMALPSISPLGPTVAGASLTAVGVFTILNPLWVEERRTIGPVTLHEGEPTTIATFLVFLGIPLVMTAFQSRRWAGRAASRRSDHPATGAPAPVPPTLPIETGPAPVPVSPPPAPAPAPFATPALSYPQPPNALPAAPGTVYPESSAATYPLPRPADPTPPLYVPSQTSPNHYTSFNAFQPTRPSQPSAETGSASGPTSGHGSYPPDDPETTLRM